MATASEADTASTSGTGWRVLWGVLLIIAGILAVIMPGVGALATVLVLGWLLLLGGLFELVHAFETRAFGGFGWKLLSGVLTLVLGIWILAAPGIGILSLALLIGWFLIVTGIVRTVLAWQLRAVPGWGWVMFNGVLSIIVGILIAVHWPQSSVPVIGVLAGFSLITSGIWRIVLRHVRLA